MMHLGAADDSTDFEPIYELLGFAADKLDGLAHLLIGELNRTGRGRDPDPELALLHYTIAALLLPPGKSRSTSLQHKESMLASNPGVRPDVERRSLAYIQRRNGRLPS